MVIKTLHKLHNKISNRNLSGWASFSASYPVFQVPYDCGSVDETSASGLFYVVFFSIEYDRPLPIHSITNLEKSDNTLFLYLHTQNETFRYNNMIAWYAIQFIVNFLLRFCIFIRNTSPLKSQKQLQPLGFNRQKRNII